MSSKRRTPQRAAQAAMTPTMQLDGLTFTIKPSKSVHIEIDLDALTFDDVMLLQKMDTANDEEMDKALAIISLIIGQDAKALPIRHLKTVIKIVMQNINGAADQGN